MRVREMEIGEVQERFANLVWDNEPIPSGQLVKLCEQVSSGKSPPPIRCCASCVKRGCFRM